MLDVYGFSCYLFVLGLARCKKNLAKNECLLADVHEDMIIIDIEKKTPLLERVY